MIETKIIRYLGNTLPEIPAYAERPEKPPEEYFIIERTGGGYENHIDRATVAIQSYADSLFRAAEINRMMEIKMRRITDLKDISRCKLNSSYNFTDEESRKYRYQAVFDIIYMEGE